MRRGGSHSLQQLENMRIVFVYLEDHPCVDCGETNKVVLDFDHFDGQKTINISHELYRGLTVEQLREEITHCEVRCANCHRKRHYATSYRGQSLAALDRRLARARSRARWIRPPKANRAGQMRLPF